MRFIARVFGTWMIALAVILLVVDGTKSLAADAPVMTSLGALWASLHAPSWAAFGELVVAQLEPYSAVWVADAVFGVPAWGFAAIVGIVALVLGRKRRKPVYADTL